MIYRPETPLDPLPELALQKSSLPQEPSLGVLRKAAAFGYVLLTIPALPFILAYAVGKAVLAIPGEVERATSLRERRQAQYGFEYDRIVVRDSYDARAGELKITMNYDALKAFAAALAQMFSEAATGGPMVKAVLPPGRIVGPRSPGWHAHGSDFFDWLENQLIIATTDCDVFELHEGWRIHGSPEAWRRLAAAWLEVADRRETCLIVLDRDQTDWCAPRSTGRFVIAYQPDTSSQAAEN